MTIKGLNKTYSNRIKAIDNISLEVSLEVADLCPQIAIMNRGKIVNAGSPRSLILKLQGKVWTKIVEQNEELLPDLHFP